MFKYNFVSLYTIEFILRLTATTRKNLIITGTTAAATPSNPHTGKFRGPLSELASRLQDHQCPEQSRQVPRIATAAGAVADGAGPGPGGLHLGGCRLQRHQGDLLRVRETPDAAGHR